VENPSCKEQLMAAAREVVNAVEDLVSVCNLTQHENNKHLLQELSDAAYQVTTTLNQLLNRLTSASRYINIVLGICHTSYIQIIKVEYLIYNNYTELLEKV